MNNKKKILAMAMLAAAFQQENRIGFGDDPRPPKKRLRNLLPGQRQYIVEDGHLMEILSHEYDPEDQNIILARSGKAARAKAKKRNPEVVLRDDF